MVAIVALERGICTVIKDEKKYSISVALNIVERTKSPPMSNIIRFTKNLQTHSTYALLFPITHKLSKGNTPFSLIFFSPRPGKGNVPDSLDYSISR